LITAFIIPHFYHTGANNSHGFYNEPVVSLVNKKHFVSKQTIIHGSKHPKENSKKTTENSDLYKTAFTEEDLGILG